jgi:DNA repair protein RadC
MAFRAPPGKAIFNPQRGDFYTARGRFHEGNLLERCKINEVWAPSCRKFGTSDRDRRWRLDRFGPEGLTDRELVSCVLGPGGRVSAAETARRLLERYPELGDLAAERPASLVRGFGLGPARTARLLAAFELGFRAGGPVRRAGFCVNGPGDVHPLLREEFRGLDRERFLALYLDTRHRVVTVETVSIGSLNASLVHPREVFKPAVAMSAAAVIVAHNHPSGDPDPSGDDLDLTARLDRCGDLLGIALLDHLVVGDEDIISIREYGWPESPRD